MNPWFLPIAAPMAALVIVGMIFLAKYIGYLSRLDDAYYQLLAAERRATEIVFRDIALTELRGMAVCPRCGTKDGDLGEITHFESGNDHAWCPHEFHEVRRFDFWPTGEDHDKAEAALARYGVVLYRTKMANKEKTPK